MNIIVPLLQDPRLFKSHRRLLFSDVVIDLIDLDERSLGRPEAIDLLRVLQHLHALLQDCL